MTFKTKLYDKGQSKIFLHLYFKENRGIQLLLALGTASWCLRMHLFDANRPRSLENCYLICAAEDELCFSSKKCLFQYRQGPIYEVFFVHLNIHCKLRSKTKGLVQRESLNKQSSPVYFFSWTNCINICRKHSVLTNYFPGSYFFTVSSEIVQRHIGKRNFSHWAG